jgi:hypothetical protein
MLLHAISCRSDATQARQRLPKTIDAQRAAANPAGTMNYLCRFGVYLVNFGLHGGPANRLG